MSGHASALFPRFYLFISFSLFGLLTTVATGLFAAELSHPKLPITDEILKPLIWLDRPDFHLLSYTNNALPRIEALVVPRNKGSSVFTPLYCKGKDTPPHDCLMPASIVAWCERLGIAYLGIGAHGDEVFIFPPQHLGRFWALMRQLQAIPTLGTLSAASSLIIVGNVNSRVLHHLSTDLAKIPPAATATSLAPLLVHRYQRLHSWLATCVANPVTNASTDLALGSLRNDPAAIARFLFVHLLYDDASASRSQASCPTP